MRAGTAAQCAGGWGLVSPHFSALASESTAQPRQSPPAHTASCQPSACQRCCKTLSLGTIAACARRRLSTAFSQSPGARRASGDWPGLGRCRWTWRCQSVPKERYPRNREDFPESGNLRLDRAISSHYTGVCKEVSRIVTGLTPDAKNVYLGQQFFELRDLLDLII